MPLELLGAFMSGVGSILGAGFCIKLVIKRCDRECELRMDAFREGLEKGRSEE